jgi:beta-mannosidase
MTRYFRVPASFDRFVYVSQVQQALAMQMAVRHWRRLRPVCMGTLYWQLNDLWPVCSWSSLEYGGRWKLLHYAAKRFYAPAIASALVEGDAVEAWLVNDGPAALRGTLEARVIDFSGRVLWRKRLPASLGAGAAKRAARWALAQLAPDPRAAFFHLTLAAGKARDEHTLFFTEPKRCELQPARIRKTVWKTAAGLAVELSADKPAFYVSLDAPGLNGRFADNLFTLLPGEKRTVVFQSKEQVTAGQLAKALTICDLRSTY